MFTGFSGDEDGLQGYWKFDTGADTIAYDHSGNANHGDINGAGWNGAATYGCTDPYAGNYDPDAVNDDGSCTDFPDNGEYFLGFDGVDDYVEVPDDNSLDAVNALTISGWIKPDVNGNSACILSKSIPGSGSYIDDSYILFLFHVLSCFTHFYFLNVFVVIF